MSEDLFTKISDLPKLVELSMTNVEINNVDLSILIANPSLKRITFMNETSPTPDYFVKECKERGLEIIF